ncbi:hypothetical protein LOTGIDRAFT_190901 [Lottia gigantea]|uniref:40S ribosomal protein S7 n=1 Tax=Lottia gigantea TaxID=225164 RepID=V4BU02_LOTGI|nr:hypothetical protein LOTGIDRAFT_190901 [Lottia gigantea]ESO92454.1 hypothetical protein LOTGIDRAFT_190901 [Lottia gigantea]
MYNFRSKIRKPNGERPSDIEYSLIQALFELETNSDLKLQLRELHIVSAREVEIAGKKAIVIFVPYILLRNFQKIQTRLVRELEKKYSGKHVVFVAQRKILAQPKRNCKQKNRGKKQKLQRSRLRTLTKVHEDLLDDICYPAEIVGKRIRIKLDGSRLIKVHLDKTQQTNIEHKVDTFSAVYKTLTGKDVKFEFPENML